MGNGYTHYFTRKIPIPTHVWRQIIRDARYLAGRLPEHSISAGGYFDDEPLRLALDRNAPDAPPEFSADAIRFNGTGRMGLSGDTFLLTPEVADGRFEFCDTSRKPYDFFVCVVLTLIYTRVPGCLDIASTGSREDWLPAAQFAADELGEDMYIPHRITGMESNRVAPREPETIDLWMSA
ncbi:hypothetical protein [Thioalkalivibrio sp. ALMg11]|uniref:hypothetical protein n=1 Tax=Thioalkalivibrio sp. ALMg11 TaxID=1158165 RepID=UPI0003752657|nr:hypothetical protein [Thioalkalivibrio sp. ALMg11]